MTTFGQYECLERIRPGPGSSVYPARRAEGGDLQPYMIKFFRPQRLPGLADPSEQVARFREQVSAQVAAASAEGASHWATLHPPTGNEADGWVGSADDGVYYIIDRYPFSLRRFIEGDIDTRETDIRAVMSSIVAGLEEQKSASGRAHGNLKPTNVLLTGRPRDKETAIVVTDPAPASALGAEGGEAADMQALGEILYAMVTHRRFPGQLAWPVDLSRPWQRLGSTGEPWHRLCNDLLAPLSEDGVRTLDQLSQRLAEIPRPRRPRVILQTSIGAALVLVILTTVAIILQFTRPGPQHESKFGTLDEEFWALHAAMNPDDPHEGWLRPLTVLVAGEEYEHERQLLENRFPLLDDVRNQEPFLSILGVIEKVRPDENEFRPEKYVYLKHGTNEPVRGPKYQDIREGVIAGRPLQESLSRNSRDTVKYLGGVLTTLMEMLNAYRDEQQSMISRLRDANLSGLAQSFAGVLDLTIQEEQIREHPPTADSDGEAGRQQPATILKVNLDNLIDMVLAQPHLTSMVDQVNEVEAGLSAIQEVLGDNHEIVREVEGLLGERIQSHRMDSAQTFAAFASDVAERLRNAARPANELRFLVENRRSEIRWERLIVEVTFEDLTNDGEGVHSVLAALHEKAADYLACPDPRNIARLEELVGEAESTLQHVPRREDVETFSGRIDGIRNAIHELQAYPDPVAFELEDRRSAQARLEQQLQALVMQIRAASVPDAHIWLPEIRAKIDSASTLTSAVLYAEFSRLLSDILGEVSADHLNEDFATYAPLYHRARTVESACTLLERETQSATLGDLAALDAGSVHVDVAKDWITDRREARLRACLDRIDWDRLWQRDFLPVPEELTVTHFSDAVRAEIDRLDAEVAGARAVLVRADEVGNLLSQAWALGDPIPDSHSTSGNSVARATVAGLANELKAEAESLGFASAVEPILARVRWLEEILAFDPSELYGWIGASLETEQRLEVNLAGWRRALALARVWPIADSPDGAAGFGPTESLQLEASLYERLIAQIARTLVDPRRQSVTQRVVEEGVTLWMARAAAALPPDSAITNDAAFRQVLTYRDDFSVDPKREFAEKSLAYNMRLADLHTGAKSEPESDPLRLKEQVQSLLSLIETIRRDRPELASTDLSGLVTKLQDWMAEVDKGDAGKFGGQPQMTAGPGAADWELDQEASDPDHLFLIFRPGPELADLSAHQLGFIQIAETGREATYMLVDEFPLGLFIDLFDHHGQWMAPTIPMHRRTPGKGVRTWIGRANGEGIEPADGWIDDPEGVYYPPEAAFEPGRIGKPTRRHPITRVAPVDAAIAAYLLRCRLPTAEEWTLAKKSDDSGRIPNRADAGLIGQLHEHIATVNAGRESTAHLPLPDAQSLKSAGSQEFHAVDFNADDDSLWFRETDLSIEPSRPLVRNRIGNVAEFVAKDSSSSLTNLEKRTLQPWIYQRSDQVEVIGASALSSRTIDPEQTYPLIGEIFSDVGFRVAFTIERNELKQTPGRALVRLLEDHARYLAVDLARAGAAGLSSGSDSE